MIFNAGYPLICQISGVGKISGRIPDIRHYKSAGYPVQPYLIDTKIEDHRQGGRGHWAAYYTSPKRFIITFSYSLAQQFWGLALNL